jgi:hypothetical protein
MNIKIITILLSLLIPTPVLAQAQVFNVNNNSEQFQINYPEKANGIVKVDSVVRRDVAVIPGQCRLIRLRFPAKEDRAHNYIDIGNNQFLIEAAGGTTQTPQLTDVTCENGTLNRETPDIFTDAQNRLVINGNRLNLSATGAVRVGWWEVRNRSFRLNSCGISPIFTGIRRVEGVGIRISELEMLPAPLFCRDAVTYFPEEITQN